MNSARLIVTLDESVYSELSRLVSSLDLSAACLIRWTDYGFITRYRAGIKSDLPLLQPVDMPIGRGGKREIEVPIMPYGGDVLSTRYIPAPYFKQSTPLSTQSSR